MSRDDLRGLVYDRLAQKALQDAIDRLPPTAAGVATFLIERGVVGDRCRTKDCAVSVYLRAELGDDLEPLTSVAAVSLMRDGEAVATVLLPREVGLFVTRFDEGDFPELVSTAGPELEVAP